MSNINLARTLGAVSRPLPNFLSSRAANELTRSTATCYHLNPFLIVKTMMEEAAPGRQFSSYEIFLALLKLARYFEDFEEEINSDGFWKEIYFHIFGNEKILKEASYRDNCQLRFVLSQLEKEIPSARQIDRQFPAFSDNPKLWQIVYERVFPDRPKDLGCSWKESFAIAQRQFPSGNQSK